MARKNGRSGVDRRKFLTGVAVTGAASAVAATGAVRPAAAAAAAPAATRPSTAAAQRELGTASVQVAPGTTPGTPGSDFMVDVIRSLDIDYVFSNPASSARGIHESITTYAGNKKPEFITCMHEESAVAMTHGYFKVAGKPAIALMHGTVGLQHGAMAVYNAWCDRAASILMVGNRMDAVDRQPGVPTIHAVQDPGLLTRDFTKWDDNPQSLQHFAESTVRAYKIAMTPPYEPVLIAVEEKLQEESIEQLQHGKPLGIPKLNRVAPPAGDPNAVREAAKLLAMADNPVIVADRSGRTQAGVKALVELAETLNCPVVDNLGRMNMPNQHHLCRIGGGNLIEQADVILGLELTDLWGSVNSMDDSVEMRQASRLKQGAKLINISMADIYIRANYQDFMRYQQIDIAIGADAEATLPMLTEYVRQAIPADRQSVIAARGEAAKKAYACKRASARCRPPPRMRGTRSRSARRVSRPKSGSTSRTRTGRWCRATPASRTGRTVCGTSASITSSSADRAARASATASPPRSARRWRIATTAGGLPSTSRTTAIPCTRRARSGRRCTTTFRCSRSCGTTAPITRKSCTFSAWPTGVSAASRTPISARRSGRRSSTSRSSRSPWA